MPEIQSPCLSCHLKNYSKDNPTCRDCNARCNYIKIIDGAAPSTSILSANEKASSTKLQRAELYIQQTCKKNFIELDDLKSQRYAGGLGAVKREIVKTLRHKYNLTLLEIGTLTGRSQQAISVMLKPKVIKPAKAVEKTQTENTVLDEAGTTHTPQPDPLNKLDRSTQEPYKKVIYFSFEDHPTLYDHLIKTAKTNFRKPEDHILYLINKEREGSYSISYKQREGSDEIKETFQPGTESP